MTKENNQTPQSDAKMDAQAVAALIALIMNSANQGSAGSLAAVLGNASQLAASVNSSQTSVKDNADINVPESMSGYVGLALNNATGHHGRMQVQAEQITQNAITQANSIVTDAITQKHKRTTDADVVADFLHLQGIRGESLAQDRIWNIDEQVAAAEVLYAALGKFIGSQQVQVEPK
jgi:hypothetical protein